MRSPSSHKCGCLASAEAHPCLWEDRGGGQGPRRRWTVPPSPRLLDSRAPGSVGLTFTLCRQNVGPREHRRWCRPSPGPEHVARMDMLKRPELPRVVGREMERDRPVRETRSGLAARGARHSVNVQENADRGAAPSGPGPGPGAAPQGRCLSLCTWEPRGCLHTPQACPLAGPPFSGPRFLAVTPLPFCALRFCKSRNPGTETSPQALREAGQPGDNGLAPALPHRPQTTFPARQLSVHFLRGKRNLGCSRQGGRLCRAAWASAPLSTHFHLEICHVLPKWQGR